VRHRAACTSGHLADVCKLLPRDIGAGEQVAPIALQDIFCSVEFGVISATLRIPEFICVGRDDPAGPKLPFCDWNHPVHELGLIVAGLRVIDHDERFSQAPFKAGQDIPGSVDGTVIGDNEMLDATADVEVYVLLDNVDLIPYEHEHGDGTGTGDAADCSAG